MDEHHAIKWLQPGPRLISGAGQPLSGGQARKSIERHARQADGRDAGSSEGWSGLPPKDEKVLECLGAAVIMRWGTLPTKIQRELFDHATSLADLAQTAPPNDDSAHNSDGLLLNGLDGDQQVTGSSAGVSWTTGSIPDSPTKGGKSLYRAQYNELGKRNLAAIERIVTFKYQRGPAFNRQ